MYNLMYNLIALPVAAGAIYLQGMRGSVSYGRLWRWRYRAFHDFFFEINTTSTFHFNVVQSLNVGGLQLSSFESILLPSTLQQPNTVSELATTERNHAVRVDRGRY